MNFQPSNQVIKRFDINRLVSVVAQWEIEKTMPAPEQVTQFARPSATNDDGTATTRLTVGEICLSAHRYRDQKALARCTNELAAAIADRKATHRQSSKWRGKQEAVTGLMHQQMQLEMALGILSPSKNKSKDSQTQANREADCATPCPTKSKLNHTTKYAPTCVGHRAEVRAGVSDQERAGRI